MERKTEILVVGGGSTGTSVLYNLAKRGATKSMLIDRAEQVGSGQTSRSTGLVRTHYSDETVARMALLSYKFFQRFSEEVPGESCGFTQTGLLVCADPRSDHGLRENVEMFNRIGIQSEIIDKEEAKRIEPELDGSLFSTISYEPQSGYAETSLTAASFAKAAQRMGSEILPGTNLLKIARRQGGYEVLTSAGTILTEKLILATGVWSKPILAGLKISVPIKVVRHPVIILRRPEQYAGNRPLIFDFPRKTYYKPEGQHLFYAGSLEPELDVNDVEPDNYDSDVSFEEIEKYSKSVAEAIPIVGQLGSFVRGYTGLYDMTVDQQPIIDEFSDADLPGIYCLIGLSGHGFKLSPEFGRLMAALVIDGRFTDYDISIFKRARFQEGKQFSSRYELSTVA
ncbi:MAG: FAD-binding oxidoreductase [Thaumarchaeota archaeon]|nr:FAD-binding oxidoreductase [Nitrososphaerota archaeon]